MMENYYENKYQMVVGTLGKKHIIQVRKLGFYASFRT